MEDLLKEEDFIKLRSKFWKKFWIYWILGFIIPVAYFLLDKYLLSNNSEEYVIIIIIFIVPLVFPFMIAFFKRENLDFPLKIIALVLFLSLFSSFLALVAIALSDNNLEDFEYLPLFGGVYVFYYIFVCAIILPIARFRQKNKIK